MAAPPSARRRLRALRHHVGAGTPDATAAAARGAPAAAAACAAAEAEEAEQFDVVVVGAGFAGMYALRKFRDALGLRVKVLEQADGVGGTWYWNAYPGAHCDVPVLEYSYGVDSELEQDYASRWTGIMASQPELLEYANHVKDRWDLERDITFNTKVDGCVWDDAEHRWAVSADTGARFTAQFVVTCIGCLSEPNVPDIAGRESFDGETYFTSRFPKEGVDFAGKRVAVIGTGSSGIQSIPKIAEEAETLTVFQRTPQYTLPAGHRPISDSLRERTTANYEEIREVNRNSGGGFGGIMAVSNRLKKQEEEKLELVSAIPADADPNADEEGQKGNGILDASWDEQLERLDQFGLGALYTFTDIMTDMTANAAACELFAEWIRQNVHDPDTATKLTPTAQPFGCKRQAVDTDYYITYNRPNVELVDLRRGAIKRISATGVETEQGDYAFDMIVFATGFDAMTGPLKSMGVVGTNGATITDAWEAGPRTYLGLQVADFPNMFTVTGPGSPSVLSSMIVSIEQHVDFIADLFLKMQKEGDQSVAASQAAQDEWVDHVNELSKSDLVKSHSSCNSWYLGANIPGKPRVFMPYVGGVGRYRQECEEIVAAGYKGFVFA